MIVPWMVVITAVLVGWSTPLGTGLPSTISPPDVLLTLAGDEAAPAADRTLRNYDAVHGNDSHRRR